MAAGWSTHIKVKAACAGVALALLCGPAFALDGTTPSDQKITPGRTFKSAREALRVGVDEMRTGDAQSSVQALTYAAEGGEAIAQWKLGSLYAAGEVVPRNDVLAYKYFEELVERYDEDEGDQLSPSVIGHAFVQVGLYNLNGIPGSSIKPDPARAVELFETAATRFGDADGEYQLARMFLDGVGGLDKDKLHAAKWLGLAAEKDHRDAQAELGHMLFRGDGVPRQAARGLMWLTLAAATAKGPKEGRIRDLQARDLASASDGDRSAAAAFLMARGKRDLAALLSAPPKAAAAVPATLQPLQLSGAAADPAQ